uniref:Uncharacterized protein n=1 Tax=Glossina austeni TaxID=7395 RepID=A0A1A9VDW5_GLOAU
MVAIPEKLLQMFSGRNTYAFSRNIVKRVPRANQAVSLADAMGAKRCNQTSSSSSSLSSSSSSSSSPSQPPTTTTAATTTTTTATTTTNLESNTQAGTKPCDKSDSKGSVSPASDTEAGQTKVAEGTQSSKAQSPASEDSKTTQISKCTKGADGGDSKESSGDTDIMDKCQKFGSTHNDTSFWRKVSLAAIPFAFGLSAFIFATRGEHEKDDFIPYEFLYRRNKRFPWGDGKYSLLHGKNNYDPEEEEAKIDEEAEEDGPPTPRYKKTKDPLEEKKQLREKHADKGLERRKKRHQLEKEKREEEAKEQEQTQEQQE